jgi:quinol monooxygenase YgiN
MYGTIATIRPKPGNTDAVRGMIEEWDRTRRPTVAGEVRTYLLRPDTAQDHLMLLAVFPDRASYRANAEHPDQDAWYQRLRALLEADPEWNDCEIEEIS